MVKKIADNLLNPQETKKINEWKTKLDNARVSYTDELNRIKRRTELYDGSRNVNGNPNSNKAPSKVAINVRNITYELIESQVDSSIPTPKVIPIHAEDEEAAKVIENTQRDVNIALINELAIIFNKMGIDTEAVLQAAGTKWNFLPFRPGLVGGHCIGVDR